MKNNKYTDRIAGARTLWVIEIDNQRLKRKVKPKVAFHTPKPTSNSEPISYKNLGVQNFDDEDLEPKRSKTELDLIQDLCDDIQSSCNKTAETHKHCQEKADHINDLIKTLGGIVDKFKQMLDNFKKQKPED